MKFKKVNKVTIACYADSQQKYFCDKVKCKSKCRFEDLVKAKLNEAQRSN